MSDYVLECEKLGLGSRIVPCVLDVELQRVEKIEEDQYFQEFTRLNQKEESGVEKWLKLSMGRDYDGDEVMMEFLLEIYKKLERIEERLFKEERKFLILEKKLQTHHIGHESLCFNQELQEGGIYYGRLDLPTFPQKIIPLFLQMLTPKIGKIIKMGASHSKSFDSYVVECERLEIREKREGKRE